MKFLPVNLELIKALKENCQNVPTNVTYKYLHVRVLPAIFVETTTDEERQELCELVLALPMGFAVEFMHKDVQQKYQHDVMKTYIPFIYGESGKFRQDWPLMCRTLIHYTGKMLHCDVHLQNEILKIAEDAFKTSNVAQRCAAFDCWQAFIDMYALEPKYLLHSKQINLLLKPVRARISRNRIVTAKRFDTHVYLLKATHFPDDLLERFFIEAFGPFDLEVMEFMAGDNVAHTRELSASYPKSTEILLKVLRHDKTECVCAGKVLPITDSCGEIQGEVHNWEVLVHSVRLCGQLNYLSLANARVDIIETITKCVWSSMFNYFNQDKFRSNRRQILQGIQLAIVKILNCSAMSDVYYKTFLKFILTSCVDFLDGGPFDTEVYDQLAMPLIKELIRFQHNHSEKLPATVYKEIVFFLVVYCKNHENFFNSVNNFLESNDYKCQLVGDYLEYAFYYYCKTKPNRFNEEGDDTLKAFLQQFIKFNCKHGDVLYISEGKQLVKSKSSVLMEVFENLKIEKLMCVGLLKVATSLLRSVVAFKPVSSQNLYCLLLDVITIAISAITNDMSQYTDTIKCCACSLRLSFDTIIATKTDIPEQEIEGSKLLVIYEQLLSLNQYDLLDSLAVLLNFIKRQDVPRGLYKLITLLTDYEEEVSQKAFKVLAQIHATATNGSVDSEKINGKSPIASNVLCNSPLAAHKVKILSQTVIPAVESPVTKSVRLFNEYYDSPSPKRCRGSILERIRDSFAEEKSPRSLSPVSTVPSIDEFSSSAFVVVDKKVVVDKDKMSEHQRDKTCKRREDIPALYNELTQSQSLDMKDIKVPDIEVRILRTKTSPKNVFNAFNGNENTHNNEHVARNDSHNEAVKENCSDQGQEIPNGKSKRGRKRKVSLNKSGDNGSPATAHASKKTSNIPVEETANDDLSAISTESTKVTASKEAEKLMNMNIVGAGDFFNLSRTRGKSRIDLEHEAETSLNDDANVMNSSEKNGNIDTKNDNPPVMRKKRKSSKLNGHEIDNELTNSLEINANKSNKGEKGKKTNGVNIKTRGRSSKLTNSSDEKVIDDEVNRVKKTDCTEEINPEETNNQKEPNDKVKSNLKQQNIVKPETEQKQDHAQTLEITTKPTVDIQETESEGIIPSSQSSLEISPRVNLYRLPHLSPTKKELDDAKTRKDKSAQKTTPRLSTKIALLFKDDEGDKNLLSKSSASNTSKKIAHADSKCANKNDETLTLDMLGDISKESDIADMDTASFTTSDESMHLALDDASEIQNDNATPAKAERSTTSVSSLDASPITKDTPSRNKELLDDTSDISPIKTGQINSAIVRLSPDLFASQATQEELGQQQGFDLPPQNVVDNNDEIQTYFKPEESTAALKNPSSRSAKLLTLTGQTARMSSPVRSMMNHIRPTNISSPSTDRIKNMMKLCTDSKSTESQGLHKVQKGDILEFERVVPSPLALPKSSILKRKADTLEDGGQSPCAKRKRVNFPDPPTTCEKLYFKDIVEKDKPIALRKKKRFVQRLISQEAELSAAEKQEEPTPAEDASDAIQSMQNQIDGLEFEGVVPLDSSPPKEHPIESGRVSPLPSNPAPELLETVLPTAYEDLFPCEEPTSSSPKKSDGDKDTFIQGVFALARNTHSVQSYLNLSLKEIPTNAIKKWLKERESKQRRENKHRRKMN